MVISASAAGRGHLAIDQPWKPARATEETRKLARDEKLQITYSVHARQRLIERDLTTGDALYVLKHGFVYEDPECASREGLYKYRVESRSPNSGSRTLRVVVIPDPSSLWIKVVTIMFLDET